MEITIKGEPDEIAKLVILVTSSESPNKKTSAEDAIKTLNNAQNIDDTTFSTFWHSVLDAIVNSYTRPLQEHGIRTDGSAP